MSLVRTNNLGGDDDPSRREHSQENENTFRYGTADPTKYPIDGLNYAIEHRELWSHFGIVCCASLCFSFFALVLLFVFALEPQAEAIGGKQWWSWIVAVVLILAEVSVLSELVLPNFLCKSQAKIFVTIMQMEGMWNDDTMQQPPFIKTWLTKTLCCKQRRLIRLILSPIKVFPFVGDILYSGIFGIFIAWEYMDLYFEAIQLPDSLQRLEIFGDKSYCSTFCVSLSQFQNTVRQNEYVEYGFLCAFLECIPLVGPAVFPLTNSIGAALFACDIERYGGPSVAQAATRTLQEP
jgi:hypothetical protein